MIKRIALSLLALGLLAPCASADVVLYASDYSNQLSTFNTTTYSATIKGTFSPSFFAAGMDFRSNGQLYAITTTLRTINTSNAQTTQIGGTLPEQMASLAFSASDQLYAVSLSGNHLYQINPNTGAVIGSSVTITGTSGFSVSGIDFAANGTLYAGAGDNLYTINLTTGAATTVKSNVLPNSEIFTEIDIGSDNMLRTWVYPYNSPTIATIDLSGNLQSTSTVSGLSTVQALASAGPFAVPEPSTLLLVGVGLPIMLATRRAIRRPKASLPKC
jgi:outer membrane protein assembly factor BamB